MGAAAGGVIGNASGQDAKSTAIGAVIGAGFGTLFGYLGHEEKKRQDLAKFAIKTQPGKPKMPSITKPQVRAVWVPDRVEDDTFISGHFIYVLDRPTTFKQE